MREGERLGGKRQCSVWERTQVHNCLNPVLTVCYTQMIADDGGSTLLAEPVAAPMAAWTPRSQVTRPYYISRRVSPALWL
jgi:hypothetical protein